MEFGQSISVASTASGFFIYTGAQVATDDDGCTTVIWVDGSNNSSLTMRRYDENGTALGDPTVLGIAELSAPNIRARGSFTYILWTEVADTLRVLHLRIINGTTLGATIQINPTVDCWDESFEIIDDDLLLIASNADFGEGVTGAGYCLYSSTTGATDYTIVDTGTTYFTSIATNGGGKAAVVYQKVVGLYYSLYIVEYDEETELFATPELIAGGAGVYDAGTFATGRFSPDGTILAIAFIMDKHNTLLIDSQFMRVRVNDEWTSIHEFDLDGGQGVYYHGLGMTNTFVGLVASVYSNDGDTQQPFVASWTPDGGFSTITLKSTPVDLENVNSYSAVVTTSGTSIMFAWQAGSQRIELITFDGTTWSDIVEISIANTEVQGPRLSYALSNGITGLTFAINTGGTTCEVLFYLAEENVGTTTGASTGEKIFKTVLICGAVVGVSSLVGYGVYRGLQSWNSKQK